MSKYNLLDKQDMAQLRHDVAKAGRNDPVGADRAEGKIQNAETRPGPGACLCPPSPAITPSFTRVKLGKVYGVDIEMLVDESKDPRWKGMVLAWFEEALTDGL